MIIFSFLASSPENAKGSGVMSHDCGALRAIYLHALQLQDLFVFLL